jgi:hypothetical protein
MLNYEIKQNSFKLRVTGNGPTFLTRRINLNTIAPDIKTDVWGFLFSIFSQVFEAGLPWTEKLGYQDKQGKCHTEQSLNPFKSGLSFLWLKIWSNLRRSWKHYRTGLIIPSKNYGAVDQVYRS